MKESPGLRWPLRALIGICVLLILAGVVGMFPVLPCPTCHGNLPVIQVAPTIFTLEVCKTCANEDRISLPRYWKWFRRERPSRQ